MNTSLDIVLAYFNGSRFLADQLNSIDKNLKADDLSIRIIIINDASSKSESARLRKICDKYSHIEIYRNDRNLGVIKSFERGLSISAAPYIMLSDQDDFWLPQKISLSLEKIKQIEASSPALVYTDVAITNENLEEIHRSMFEHFNYFPKEITDSILFRNIVTGCTVILNRLLLEIALPFPEEITMHDHWLAICAAYLGKLEALPEPTMLYRQHGRNQIGAPDMDLLSKAVKFKVLYPQYLKNLNLKISQMRSLALLLDSRGKIADSERIKKIADQLESGSLKDCISLIGQKVIHRSALPMLVRALLPSGKRL